MAGRANNRNKTLDNIGSNLKLINSKHIFPIMLSTKIAQMDLGKRELVALLYLSDVL